MRTICALRPPGCCKGRAFPRGGGAETNAEGESPFHLRPVRIFSNRIFFCIFSTPAANLDVDFGSTPLLIIQEKTSVMFAPLRKLFSPPRANPQKQYSRPSLPVSIRLIHRPVDSRLLVQELRRPFAFQSICIISVSFALRLREQSAPCECLILQKEGRFDAEGASKRRSEGDFASPPSGPDQSIRTFFISLQHERRPRCLANVLNCCSFLR